MTQISQVQRCAWSNQNWLRGYMTEELLGPPPPPVCSLGYGRCVSRYLVHFWDV
ncbi:hypothetical protein BDV06DRAFT_205586 [Aspergillus oleicola]